MQEKDWERVGLPPLHLTLSQLGALITAAGPTAELLQDGKPCKSPDDLIPLGQSKTTTAIVKTEDMKLELTGSSASLSFDNRFAQKADTLVHLLSVQPSQGLAMLIPLMLGVAIFVPLAVSGMSLDLVSLIALTGMLMGMIGVVIKSKRPGGPSTSPVDDDPQRWRTTFPCCDLSFADIGELAEEISGAAELEFADGENGPSVVIRAQGIALTLTSGRGEVIYDDANARMEEFYNQVQTHKRALRWFTHEDLSIFAGMLLPIAAIVLAPEASKRTAALITVVPWLAYLQWVLHRQRKCWSTITRTSKEL